MILNDEAELWKLRRQAPIKRYRLMALERSFVRRFMQSMLTLTLVIRNNILLLLTGKITQWLLILCSVTMSSLIHKHSTRQLTNTRARKILFILTQCATSTIAGMNECDDTKTIQKPVQTEIINYHDCQFSSTHKIGTVVLRS